MGTKAQALQKVTAFEASPGGTDWLKIKSDDLVTGLKDRLANPKNIDTSVVNLCGPGAFFFWLAQDDPLMYAEAVISLWKTNAALLGKRKFKASYSLRIADPGTTAAVDWVPMASLRDHENAVLNYDDAGGGLSGLTMPKGMAQWFTEAGYTDVKNDTNVFFTKGVDNLKEAERLRSLGYRVCLLIHADMLYAAKQNNKSVFPNHWVSLTGAATIGDDSVSLPVHSWGAIHTIPKQSPMSRAMFSKNYYGYVAAKPPGSGA